MADLNLKNVIPGSRVKLHLVDYFDRDHFSREDVFRELHDGVVALAKGLA